jgi:small GTP-binding protein
MKRVTTGILAHVDAGKTTLSEAMLYRSGVIRSMGRVDHGDTFLDTDRQERDRGITIFSKQAELVFPDGRLMLLDTPGHVDFSAETERTLQVLDYAVLVISGKDGVQGHTVTLWKLLEKYNIPVFIFINKMDLDGTDRHALSDELTKTFGSGCVDFTDGPEYDFDILSMCSEALMEEILETGAVKKESLADAIAERSVFPCYYGSALKLEGVDHFLEDLWQLTKGFETGSTDFGA